MNADMEEQEDELLAFHSIFGSEEFVRDETKSAGEIRVSVELPADFTVVLKEGETLRQYEISFLPPLLLTFELPEDYPSSSPPSFTLTCSWLTHTQLSALGAQLTDLYQATGGAVVLFSWVQFLKEDALGFLDIHSLLELPSDEHSTHYDRQDSLNAAPKNNQHTPKSTDNQSCDVSDPCKPDVSAPSLEVGHPIVIPADGQGPSTSDWSSTDSQGAVFLNEGDVSASLLPPSSSSDPLDLSEQGAASQPVHPRESPQNEDQTLSGLSLTPSQTLLSQLLIYNEAQKQRAFATTVFDCGVCFVGWLGSDSVKLPECGHIFCRACLAEFCKVQITDGNVKGVTCPEPDCPATPTPAQVRRLVGEELFSRYDRLLLQLTLDSMGDVVYCPRRSCGTAVIVEKSSNAALCSVCAFAFCVFCKKTYHGTSDCQTKRSTKIQEAQEANADLPQSKEGLMALWDDYSGGSKERRRLLESRYGRYIMRRTVEDYLSSDWVDSNSKHCPHCFCRIEKNGGCNHMTCSQCGQRFCWACLDRFAMGRIGHHVDSPCPLYTA
ncbi:E3 ubiquitin-protein ligase RNF14-like [Sebastes umbrosus]|uniref:E3 ubiquitin-protein ligase RNF14-like n=1 Tax=Sebastes umbrosus TaxID=72105 RepID=UPI00189D4AD0|nr:E3 ubiquitin-protein ligase RNF14-like [Sebastes umbrosus]XP_037625598.1 E3 ubiquitin-protein ligase RNF14-like [Sebastes umbrosus]